MCYVYIYLFTPVEHTQRLDALLHVRKKSKRSVDVVEVEVPVSPISLYLAALLRYLTYCWPSNVYAALVAALKTTFICDCGGGR